jgi:LPXTG-motif cell wall-anchored protein
VPPVLITATPSDTPTDIAYPPPEEDNPPPKVTPMLPETGQGGYAPAYFGAVLGILMLVGFILLRKRGE